MVYLDATNLNGKALTEVDLEYAEKLHDLHNNETMKCIEKLINMKLSTHWENIRMSERQKNIYMMI